MSRFPLPPLPPLAREAAGALALAAAACLLGCAWNAARESPLPWLYLSPDARLAREVARLSEELALPNPAETPAAPAAEIELDELVSLLPERALLLDARPAEFHALGHIPGALNLPRQGFSRAYPELREKILAAAAADIPIIAYCSGPDCEDAERIARALVELGHAPPRVFAGGWELWEQLMGE